jgi:hypothetical protein|nr:hypothetical protein [Aeromicrobium sp.]
MTPHADLYWLPLGAGGHVVRRVGQLYERIVAARGDRAPRELFHTALVVRLPDGDFVIEQVPASWHGASRGVVCTGPVGVRPTRFLPFPRYEVHCWRNGIIADVADAVASPVRVTTDADVCRRMLACLAELPTPTWGRDELGTGEMWNSNSVTAWVLAAGGVDGARIAPPRGGRAPGWAAGLTVADRDRVASSG